MVRDDGIRDNIHRYEIKLSKPSVKGIDSFTALNHECFHILFERPIKILYQQANEWATTNGILNQTLRSYYKYAYNLLEDHQQSLATCKNIKENLIIFLLGWCDNYQLFEDHQLKLIPY